LEDPVIDGILGCLYGQALGDAVGLATEFLEKTAIQKLYADQPIPFPKFTRFGHSQRWEEGDWTDDTDQMILILDGIVENEGQVDRLDFAKRLRSWVKSGFPELGDKGGMGLGMTVKNVVSQPNFLEDPHKAAEHVWINMGRSLAANGSVMRSSVLGCHNFQDLEVVTKNGMDICKVTHADPRCIHDTVGMTTLIARILQLRRDHKESTPFVLPVDKLEPLINASLADGFNAVKLTGALRGWLLSDSPFSTETQEHMREYYVKDSSVESLDALELDEQQSIGYTIKCFGSGLWALRSERSFAETIDLLAKEGGDADTNGAVAGALLGARLGYSGLPKEWLSHLRHKEWLDKKVAKFVELQSQGKIDQAEI